MKVAKDNVFVLRQKDVAKFRFPKPALHFQAGLRP